MAVKTQWAGNRLPPIMLQQVTIKMAGIEYQLFGPVMVKDDQETWGELQEISFGNTFSIDAIVEYLQMLTDQKKMQ